MTACCTKAAAPCTRRVAEALEARHADHLDEVVETLAHHFEQGAVWPKAAAYFLRAAEKAKQRYTYPTALEFAQRAHAIAERDPALEAVALQALELQGDLHSLMGELETANRSYDAADRARRRRRRAPPHREQAASPRRRAAATAPRSPTTCTAPATRRSCSSIPSSMAWKCSSRSSSGSARSSASSRSTRAAPAHRTRCSVPMA